MKIALYFVAVAAVTVVGYFYRQIKRKHQADTAEDNHITLPVFDAGCDPIEDRVEIRYINRRDG